MITIWLIPCCRQGDSQAKSLRSKISIGEMKIHPVEGLLKKEVQTMANMVKEERRVKFEVGERVTTLSGDWKGTVTRLGRLGESAQVRWDNGQQQLILVSELKKG